MKLKHQCIIRIIHKLDDKIKYEYEVEAPSPILAWELITKLLKHDKSIDCVKYQLSDSKLSEV